MKTQISSLRDRKRVAERYRRKSLHTEWRFDTRHALSIFIADTAMTMICPSYSRSLIEITDNVSPENSVGAACSRAMSEAIPASAAYNGGSLPVS